MGQVIVVQSADVQQRDRQVERRLGVGRIKLALFRGMLVGPNRHVQRLLHVGHRPFQIQNDPVGIGAADLQSIGPGEVHGLLVVLHRRAESAREFFQAQVLMVIGAVRVLLVVEQLFQASPVARREGDRQMQPVRGGQAAGGWQLRHRRRHMSAQGLQRCRRRGGHQEKQGGGESQAQDIEQVGFHNGHCGWLNR